jgi:putative endonuclease
MGVQRLLTRRAKGQAIEKACHIFLLNQKIKIITTNFYSKCGEIDLIGIDQQTLIFFEVRYRQQQHYGSALESVTLTKQKRIYKTALFFLMQHPKFRHFDYRFDIITASTYNNEIIFHWLKNAFQIEATWT